MPAIYDPLDEAVSLFLPSIKSLCESRRCDIIEEIINIINHESMHHALRRVLGIPTSDRVEKEHRVFRLIGMY